MFVPHLNVDHYLLYRMITIFAFLHANPICPASNLIFFTEYHAYLQKIGLISTILVQETSFLFYFAFPKTNNLTS